MIKYYLLLVLTLSFWSLAQSQNIIPRPNEVTESKGMFFINQNTVFTYDKTTAFSAEYLAEYLKANFQLNVSIDDKDISPDARWIEIKTTPGYDLESYFLEVDEKKIRIGGGAAGCYYGVQSLIQLLKPENNEVAVPCVKVKDSPRFGWRGLHLDVSRHFFSVDFIKKYIDLMSRYKLNTFHWHLTDDQGWRIEIKKYPKLTQVGAWRKETIVDKNFQPFVGDGKPYGGFYTQEQIRDVVDYARKRHVTVVPEIEMPGHALAALAAYPEYSCTGGPFDVGTKWGVFDDVFCPTEATFRFLEDILTEVTALFPSEFIHIGGDECPKVRWRNSEFCQKMMKEKGLKDEHELQSYFIRRIEIILASQGRKLIGWDEILEGGLAPGAAVMSWRGEQGGIDAAKAGHQVVMSPGTHCYFDHYQSKSAGEPLAIGGFTPIEKVYQYNPIPTSLNESEAKFILGAQANVWTEYMKTSQQVEYMTYPRVCALSEVLWTHSQNKNADDFFRRLMHHFSLLELWKVNFSRAFLEIKPQVKPGGADAPLKVTLNQRNPSGSVYYTTDGSDPSMSGIQYSGDIAIKNSLTLRYSDRSANGKVIQSQNFVVSKSTGKTVELKHPPDERYGENGSFGLVDGILADENLSGGRWLGWWGPDLNAVIDLGKAEPIQQVEIGLLRMENSWIYLPQFVEIYGSLDGQTFELLKRKESSQYSGGGRIPFDFSKQNTRFVKVIAKNFGIIPHGKEGEGNKAWLFVDEILVR